ncbi:MAG: heme-binding domain-containing protein, partial [Ignavibacteriales bacterium]|nr:heme-binding domain-containing protein [Ignavibacteriales bacterium]
FIAGLLVILQFIRPAKNILRSDSQHDITKQFRPPPEIESILRTSCYDCHSDSTRYPWYAEVQPVGWWLNNHIHDAKQELNFSEFASYRLRRQYRKLEEMIKQVNEGEMPLPSYLIIHTDARLSQQEKDQFVAWVNAMRDTMKTSNPVDSLMRRQ